MDRQIVYPAAIPLDTDILSIQRNTMVALGFLAQAAIGSSTVVDGLACTPTTVPSMSVNVGPGSIFTLSTVDATAFGSLAADNTDALVKVGVNLAATAFTMTAPGTTGQSINYLIEAAFVEADGTPVALPYYNASNPAVPYSGPSNSGATQNTQRLQRVGLQLKTGSPATTGTQVTPAVDSGYVALYVITVAYAQTTITSGNIAIASGAPFIGAKVGSGLVTTTAMATAIGGAFPISNGAFGVSTTLTAANSGTYYNVGGSGTTQTLPAASGATGKSFGFFASAAFILATAGGVIYGFGTSTSSVAIASGQFICLQSDGSNWRIFSMSPGINRSVAPACARSTQGVFLGASYNGSQTVSFTAPCAGYVVAVASLNMTATATNPAVGALILNGTTVATDSTLLSQSFSGVLSVAAGASVTATMQVTTTTSTGINATYEVTAFFVPYP